MLLCLCARLGKRWIAATFLTYLGKDWHIEEISVLWIVHLLKVVRLGLSTDLLCSLSCLDPIAYDLNIVIIEKLRGKLRLAFAKDRVDRGLSTDLVLLLIDITACMLHLACHAIALHLVLFIQIDVGTYSAHFGKDKIVVSLVWSRDQVLL